MEGSHRVLYFIDVYLRPKVGPTVDPWEEPKSKPPIVSCRVRDSRSLLPSVHR